MIYKKNFLKKVIFRVDFEQIELTQLSKFFSTIKDEFPNQEEQKGFEGAVQVNLESGKVKQEQKEFFSWIFSNRQKTKRFYVSSKFTILEYDKYRDSKELISDIEKFLSSFLNQFEVKTLNRVGLRYLNQIELKETNILDWEDYLDDALIANLKFSLKNSFNLARVMGQLIIKKENYDISFNYGIPNSDFPSEITRKEFLLDYDCHSKLPTEASDINIIEVAKTYNKELETLFEKSIKAKFRELLGQ